jgi:N-terminal acetyltransferase B complex catalytic subunit
MPIVRRVRPTDLLSLNLCNLDSYTENYDLNFYLTYLMKWPSLFQCVEEDGGKIVAYSLLPSLSAAKKLGCTPVLTIPTQ